VSVALMSCSSSSKSSPSSACDITAFSFAIPAATGTITGTNIAVTVPYGTALTALVATFTASDGASVKVGSTAQVSGTTANNFTSAVSYVVTAADGTTSKTYTVTVTVAPGTACDITAFGFVSPSVTGTISGTNIAVSVPSGTSVTALVATFTITGASVKVGTTTQVSGTTANNFTSPVSYVVTSGDGSTTKTYTVTVTVLSGPAPTPLDAATWNFTHQDGTTAFTPTISASGISIAVDSGFDQIMWLKTNPAATDMTITVTFSMDTIYSGKGIRVFARSAAAAELTNGCEMVAVTPSVMKLYFRPSSGNSSAIATATPLQISTGITDATVHTIVFTLSGTSLSATYDGGSATTATDSTSTVAGKFGIICEKNAGITVKSVIIQ
jgi:hypothetical protein